MRRTLDRLRNDQRGVSLAEVMIGMVTFLIVFGAILTMVQAAMHNQDRITRNVVANQKARPVLTRIIDQLHSSCIAPAIAPIQAGSTSNSLIFIGRFGRDVMPTPERKVISFVTTPTQTSLTEQTFAVSGGQAPLWTFSTTQLGPTRTLLTGVSQGRYGNPSVAVPVFRYYAYIGGTVSTTPLPVPLSAADAARTVQVDIAFATSAGRRPAPDVENRVTLTDSTTLRLEPASEDSAEVNLPCV